jgi:hypothetical protein
MKYAVEMGSDVMLYIPSFIETGSGIQELIHRYTEIQTACDIISLLLFFEYKEGRLKMRRR